MHKCLKINVYLRASLGKSEKKNLLNIEHQYESNIKSLVKSMQPYNYN